VLSNPGFDNTFDQYYDIPVDGEFFIESMESTGRSTLPAQPA